MPLRSTPLSCDPKLIRWSEAEGNWHFGWLEVHDSFGLSQLELVRQCSPSQVAATHSALPPPSPAPACVRAVALTSPLACAAGRWPLGSSCVCLFHFGWCHLCCSACPSLFRFQGWMIVCCVDRLRSVYPSIQMDNGLLPHFGHFLKKFVYLVFIWAMRHGVWDLSSLTRDQTCAPCIGSRLPQKSSLWPF